MQNHMSLVKDVRGCMTRFDPLTPEIVSDQSDDGLTYGSFDVTVDDDYLIRSVYNGGQLDEVSP